MSRPVTVRIGPQHERGTARLLSPGQVVTLGQVMPGAGAARVNVPGRWIGVGRDQMVPTELLTVSYSDWGSDGATVDWRAGAECDPSSLRFLRGASTATWAEASTCGRFVVAEGSPAQLVVARMNVQTDRFVPRLVVAVELAEVELAVATAVEAEGPTVFDEVHDWGELVELWWMPRRERGRPAALTWRTGMAVTFRLAGEAPQGRLARIVAQGLQRRGYPDVASPRVYRIWGRAMERLCQVLCDPGLQWMLDEIDLPRLSAAVERMRAGDPVPGIPAGEQDLRRLRQALRRTGRPEWQ